MKFLLVGLGLFFWFPLCNLCLDWWIASFRKIYAAAKGEFQ